MEPEVERAMRLPKHAEPLVNAAESTKIDDHATRQMRRRARRAEGKAARNRRPTKAAVVDTQAREEAGLAVAPVEAPAESQVEATIAAPVEFSSPLSQDAPAPVPSNRALVSRPSSLLERLFGGWLLRRPARIARCDPDALNEQMLVLRTELALVQRRLDRIIAATASG
jgi:hypothetical protein